MGSGSEILLAGANTREKSLEDSQQASRRSSRRSDVEMDPGYGAEAVGYPYEFPIPGADLPVQPERRERFDGPPKAAPAEVVRRNQAKALAAQRPEPPPAPLPGPMGSMPRGSTTLSRPTTRGDAGRSTSMSSSTASGSAGYGGGDPSASRARQRGRAAVSQAASSSGEPTTRPGHAEAHGADAADAYRGHPAEEEEYEDPRQRDRQEIADRVNAEIVNRILDPRPVERRRVPFPQAAEMPPSNGVNHGQVRMRDVAVNAYYQWDEVSEEEDSDGSFEAVEEPFDEPGSAIDRLI